MRAPCTQALRGFASATILIWAAGCVVVYRGLVEAATSAPPGTIDEYARNPGFQLLNFTFGYFPMMLCALAVALAFEWGVCPLLRSAVRVHLASP